MSSSPTITKQSSRINSELTMLRLGKMMRRGEIHLLPGGRLPPERELAKLLDVSLFALRNGIRSLSEIGFLRSQPGVGTFVVDSIDFTLLDSASLRLFAEIYEFTADEMFETRVLLELQIAALAAERATYEDLTQMAEEVTEMFASLDKPELFLLHNVKFHQAIAAASKNRILIVLANLLTNIFFEESHKTVFRSADMKLLAKMHLQIYRAIRERNSEAAGNMIRNYLVKTRRSHKLKNSAPRSFQRR